MNIKLELLSEPICDIVRSRLEDIDIDADKIAQTAAIAALTEIQQVLGEEDLSEFDKIEGIVMIFEKYHLDFGGCHDFS